jgi:hypothetical protein
MTKKTRIHKYPPEFADVEVGEYWLVQIEPITINTCPKKCVIVEITKTTVSLRFTAAVNPVRYAFFAVRFMEKVT